MADPCAEDSGVVPGRCVRNVWVEIELSDFPAGWADDDTHAPPGFTKLGYALLLAVDGWPLELKVPMPGGWSETVRVGASLVQPKPVDGPVVNPMTRWLVACSVFGLAPASNYPRPPSELAALWLGSMTRLPLPEGQSCAVTLIGPYAPPAAPPHVPGGGSTG